MSDQTPNDTNQQNSDEDTSQMQRVFKFGDQLIVEDDNLMSMTNAEVQIHLSFTYPEVQNADIHSSVQNGQLVVEFLSKPGRKG